MTRTFALLSLFAVLAPTALQADEPITYILNVVHLKSEQPFEIGEAEDGLHDPKRLIHQSRDAGLLEQVSTLRVTGFLAQKILVQVGETVPVAVGQMRVPGRGGSPGGGPGERPVMATQTNYKFEETGTVLECVGHRHGNELFIELEFEQSRLGTPVENEDLPGASPKGTTSLRSTIQLKNGATAVVGSYQTSDGKSNRAMVILLTAECAQLPEEPVPAPPVPVE
ncbi:MAG: hypothetical protein R3C18_11890 [Planctomycetaceae bacterium]